MASYPLRQLLLVSLPSVAVLISYLWYKRKRIGARSDSGGSKPIEEEHQQVFASAEGKSPETVNPIETCGRARAESTPNSSPAKTLNRSLSGVETSPIDIVYPRELKTSKSHPAHISDEDLDLQIEKIKSMRTHTNSPSTISAHLSKTPSPSNKERSNSNSSTPEKQTNTTNASTSTSLVSPKKESFQITVLNSSSNSDKTPEEVQSLVATNTPKSVTPKSCTSKKNKAKNNKDNIPEKLSNKKMAQKDLATVEDKMSSLKMSRSRESPKKDTASKPVKENTSKAEDNNDKRHHEIRRKNSGRDSANHSPSDVMMASPSLSSMSDNHSEGSSDSGKGGSDLATPPPSRTPQMAINPDMPTTYEFVIPQTLVGKLIGRQGCFIQSIKDKTNAHVLVVRHPNNNRLKLCTIEGTQQEIDQALKLIRSKFPAKKYSEITLEQVHLTPLVPTVPLVPDYLYLKLIEGINNDTIVSCIVTPNHLFMQQPTHPSFPSLSMLNTCMTNCYNSIDSPLLPSPIPENTICAAYSIESWYRAIILSSDEDKDESYVKFLDFGGYALVKNDKLRQIRQDFMLLPFQAAECFLSNVKSKSEDGTWPQGAYDLVADITKGSIIYTQVANYSPEGVPLVLCYVVTGPSDIVFLNQRLVDEGYADWVLFDDTPEATQEQAVVA